MPIKVMIIEDDLIIAENLKENLLDLGYCVTGIADCFRKAVRLYEDDEPDVCIVDISLKGSQKNGIETVAYLQAGDIMPVIYLTAFNDEVLKEKAKLTHPSAYLLKPTSKAQLDITIDLALNNFKKRFNKDAKEETRQLCPFYKSKGSLFLKVKNKFEKVHLDDISCIKALGSYCCIYCNEKEYMISASLKNILSQLVHSNICRCHRSYAINLNRIDAFDSQYFYVKNAMATQQIPYSAQYKQEIMPYIIKLKSE